MVRDRPPFVRSVAGTVRAQRHKHDLDPKRDGFLKTFEAIREGLREFLPGCLQIAAYRRVSH